MVLRVVWIQMTPVMRETITLAESTVVPIFASSRIWTVRWVIQSGGIWGNTIIFDIIGWYSASSKSSNTFLFPFLASTTSPRAARPYSASIIFINKGGCHIIPGKFGYLLGTKCCRSWLQWADRVNRNKQHRGFMELRSRCLFAHANQLRKKRCKLGDVLGHLFAITRLSKQLYLYGYGENILLDAYWAFKS